MLLKNEQKQTTAATKIKKKKNVEKDNHVPNVFKSPFKKQHKRILQKKSRHTKLKHNTDTRLLNMKKRLFHAFFLFFCMNMD